MSGEISMNALLLDLAVPPMRWKINDVSFEIPDEWWERAGMAQFVPFGPAFDAIQKPGEPVIVLPEWTSVWITQRA
jgi:hypothetical protein